MSTITIKFRAKGDEYLREFSKDRGYKVPKLTHSHVHTSNRDSRTQLFLQGLNDQRVTTARLKKAGVGAVIWHDDPRASITPLGNGFMADVSIEIEV